MSDLERSYGHTRESREPVAFRRWQVSSAPAAPRTRIGAHVLVSEDGEVTGAVSGGCLERDVRRHAMWALQSGEPKHWVYDSTGDDEDAEDPFALGCNGVVEVWIERLLPDGATMGFVAACVSERQAGTVATVFASGPGAATRTGGRLLWRPGEEPLTLGLEDAELTRTLLAGARSVLASGTSSARTLDPRAERVTACFEIIEPPPRLAIFGGGYDAVPLVALARAVGARAIVVDSRLAYATRTRFPTADRLIVAEPHAAFESPELDGNSLAVVMNHNYRQDLAALKALMPTPISYSVGSDADPISCSI